MDTIVTPVSVITLDSTRIVHSIKADVVARYFPPVVRLVQYDQSLPVIAVSMMQNGQTYTLPSGAAANIRVHKPDATYVYNPALGCDSTRNIVYFEVTQAMAAASGDGLAIVEIVVNGDIAGTSLITLHFEENPVPEDAIESSDEWETIYELGERIIASTVTPVSTAAGMTDHNVVYLYTGTESGWNQGHMYYYNGTTWVDAGIAVTDTTLSVAGLAADAKKTGEEIADLKDGLTAVESDVTDLKEDFDKSVATAKATYISGHYINTDGVLIENSNFACTELIQCGQGSRIEISGVFAGGGSLAYAFYDKDEGFISGQNNIIGSASVTTIPQNASFVRLGSRNGDTDNPIGYVFNDNFVENTVLNVEAQVLENVANFAFAVALEKNLLQFVTKYVGYVYATGTQTRTANAVCDCFGLVEVKAGTTYYFKSLWADFCTYRHGSTFVQMSTVWGTGRQSGSWTPTYDGTIAITIATGRTDYLFTDSQNVYNSSDNSSICVPNHLDVGLPKIYHVEKNGSGDFTKFTDALAEATKYMDSIIYLGDGTFDIIDELGADYINTISSTNRGLYLKNRVHIIGSSNSKITCHYTGTNATVRAWICIFNTGEYGFTLENVTLEGSNLRYLVHDERDADADAYRNIYKNCYMDFYNEDRSVSSQCIGAGLGLNGEIVLDGCVFKSYQSRFPVTIHNSAVANAKSHVVVKNCLFDGSADDLDYHKGSIRVNYYGQSELITHVEVSGCSLWEQPLSEAEVAGSSPYVNVSIKAWANEIRGN